MKNYKTILLSLLLICSIALSSCTDRDKSIRVLEEQGYTNIIITGYNNWSCSEDDTFKTGFIATSIAGKQVKGTVCSAWMKGSTIRLD